MRRLVSITAALLSLALLHGASVGQQRRRGQRSKVPQTHVTYRWQERVDPVVIQHELHLYGNGFIRYSQRAGLGTPQETTLPNDAAFVESILKAYRHARASKLVYPPCGAPQGGVLIVQLSRRKRKFDLSEPGLWSRYGRLARRMIGRVVGSMPAPLEADCQPLRLRVDPSRVASARRKPAPLPTRKDEKKLLLQFGTSTSPDERLQLLGRLALIRQGDRFFRWALLRRHAGSLEARRLVRRHAAALVRGVRSRAEARELLGYLGLLQTAEALFHRSILRQVLDDPDAAQRERSAFRRALNEPRVGRRQRQAEENFRAARVDVNRRSPPWGRIRRSFSRLFWGWLGLAEQVWAGDPEQAPPLAIWLYRRALHYGRMCVLDSGSRASTGGAATVHRVRTLLRTHLARLMRGRWERYPYWHRKDLLEATGYVRRYATLFKKDWVKGHVDDRATTACRMIRMHYFDVAERYITRMAEQHPGTEGPLRHRQGQCLAEMERWTEARRVLTRAASLGVPAARVTLAEALLDQGDLAGAERELRVVAPKTAAGYRALSRLGRLRRDPSFAVKASKLALKQARDPTTWLEAGRAWLLDGKAQSARAAWLRAVKGSGPAAWEARVQMARLSLAAHQGKQAFDDAYPLLSAPERRFQVAGHVLLARAADDLGLTVLARLQRDRASYHAFRDPRSLVTQAELLVEGGHGLGGALRALHRVEGERPEWSRVHAVRAMLEGRLRRLPAALQAITAALILRPDYPPYRAIERALVKLSAAGGH